MGKKQPTESECMNHKKWAVAFSVLVIMTAVLELGELVIGFSGFEIIFNAYVPMAPTTSFCFIFLGISVIFINKTEDADAHKYIFLFLIFPVIILGMITTASYFLNLDLDFEDRVFPGYVYLNEVRLSRMSPLTGFLFTLTGIILYLSMNINNRPFKASNLLRNIAGRITFFVFVFVFVVCLAFLYGAPLAYSTDAAIPMAFTVSVAFMFLTCAIILFNKNYYPLSLLVAKTTQAYLLRNFLPFAVIPALLGGITVYLASILKIVNPALVSSAFTMVIIIKAIMISKLIARKMNAVLEKQKDHIRKSISALKISEEKYRNLFETMSQGVVYQNAEGDILSANPAAEKIMGLSLQQMMARKFDDTLWKAIDPTFNEIKVEDYPFMKALSTGKVVKDFIEGMYNSQTGEYVWILVNSVPQFKDGKPYQVFSVFLDISTFKKAEMELNQLKQKLEQQVSEKTFELAARVAELEHFHEVTIERELRMEELQREIEMLKKAPYVI